MFRDGKVIEVYGPTMGECSLALTGMYGMTKLGLATPCCEGVGNKSFVDVGNYFVRCSKCEMPWFVPLLLGGYLNNLERFPNRISLTRKERRLGEWITALTGEESSVEVRYA